MGAPLASHTTCWAEPPPTHPPMGHCPPSLPNASVLTFALWGRGKGGPGLGMGAQSRNVSERGESPVTAH